MLKQKYKRFMHSLENYEYMYTHLRRSGDYLAAEAHVSIVQNNLSLHFEYTIKVIYRFETGRQNKLIIAHCCRRLELLYSIYILQTYHSHADSTRSIKHPINF